MNRVRIVVAGGALAVLGLGVATASAAASQSSPPSAATMRAVDTAAQAGAQADYASFVVPTTTNVIVPNTVGAAGPSVVHALAANEAASAEARAHSLVATTMTGKHATTMNQDVASSFAMAVVHPASAGNPIADVCTAGGVRDFHVKSTSISGDTATVDATYTSYLSSTVYYPNGTSQSASPSNREENHMTLTRGTDGTWRVSNEQLRMIDTP